MKLFISYSRDDSAWTYEFWRRLREETAHDVWLDQRIVPASDWWHSILHEIEKCDCFVIVMSPKVVESIYCLAELDYAVALNKPVLPLMLKPCKFPAVLSANRVQYQDITNSPAMERILLKVEQGLTHVALALGRGEFSPHGATRPAEPKPKLNATETMLIAEDAAEKHNYSLAESLLQQVIDNDRGVLVDAAKERLEEIRQERECGEEYQKVKDLADNLATRKLAQKAWRAFIGKYGTAYDPHALAVTLVEPVTVTPAVIKSAGSPSEEATRRTLVVLPEPFAWIEIPRGKVTLVENYAEKSYFGKKGESKTFEVPAFMIAKYPITNAQYAKFIEAGGYRQKKWWTEAGWQTKEKEKWTEPRLWHDQNFNLSDHPVVGVSWYEALAFCLWLSEITKDKLLLPTEQQWQRAAQGDDNRAYPWGNNWDGDRCNNSVKPYDSNATTPVTHYEGKGDSPFGVVDLSGNVWEWCLTDYASGSHDVNRTDARVLRGGSWWDVNADYFRADYRDRNDPPDRVNLRGFRLARS